MAYNLLKGKKGIIFGALNDMSIAWKVAERAYEEGAQFTLTNAPVAFRFGDINELAKNFNTEAIPADATSINISSSGIVSVTTPGNDIGQEVGQLSLANFSNPRGLTPVGENFLVETAESGVAQTGAPLDGGFGKVLQGYVESSNVNVVQQLVDMIETQRAYEVSSKSITAVDEMMQFISRNL